MNTILFVFAALKLLSQPFDCCPDEFRIGFPSFHFAPDGLNESFLKVVGEHRLAKLTHGLLKSRTTPPPRKEWDVGGCAYSNKWNRVAEINFRSWTNRQLHEFSLDSLPSTYPSFFLAKAETYPTAEQSRRYITSDKQPMVSEESEGVCGNCCGVHLVIAWYILVSAVAFLVGYRLG